MADPVLRDMLDTICLAGYVVEVDFPEPGTVRMTATDEQGETWQVTGDDEIKAVTALAEALEFEDPLCCIGSGERLLQSWDSVGRM